MTFQFRFPTLFWRKLNGISSLKVPEKTVNLFLPYRQMPFYCTGASKQIFNVFEVLTDLLTFSYNYNAVRSESAPRKRYIEPPAVKQHSIDDFIANINISNLNSSVKMLTNELSEGIKCKDWRCVVKILQFFIEKKVDLSTSVLLEYAEELCNAGFVCGVEYLILLTDITEADGLTKGKILHLLAKSQWITENVNGCLLTLEECCEKYPGLSSDTKRLIRIIIHESVLSRTEAVLICVSEFVKQFTKKSNDYYLLTVLWYELFDSEWFHHQQLSCELFKEFESLPVCITILCPSLTRHFLRKRKISDVHRLLEVLLQRKMLQPYSEVTQLLFDYHCAREDKNACSEIVRISLILNAPLREEQYNKFISWTVSGNPHKFPKQCTVPLTYTKY